MKRRLLARQLQKKEVVPLPERVKNAMQEKKISGSMLSKHLQELDKDHDNYLTPEEFAKVFKVLDIPLKPLEVGQLKSKISSEKTDNVSILDFLAFFTPAMSPERLKIVEECFKTICPAGTEVTREHLKEKFGKGEFAIIGGRRININDFIDSLMEEFDFNNDGSLVFADFIHYYKKFEESIPDDEEFAKLLKTSWSF